MIRGHGNNIYQYAKGKIEVDFSSNIPYNHRSQRIAEHLKQQLHHIENYPDPEAIALRRALSHHHGCTIEQILITNGSAEALYLIAQQLSFEARSRSLITTPSFAEYEDSCHLYGHSVEFAPLTEFENLELHDVDSLWLASPNNPDGHRTKLSTICAMAERYANTTFVVDVAYNELTERKESYSELPSNIIIINSFTKSYAIPALRLGYILASESIISKIANMRPPWSVNGLALSAGEYIMAHHDELCPDVGQLIESSKKLQATIAQIEGFEPIPSDCNYFLVHLIKGTAEELQEHLLGHGLLIRNCSNFRSLTNQHIRIATQGTQRDQQLIDALKSWR